MTATVSASARVEGLGPNPLAGTKTLLHLAIRRERIPIVAWVWGVSVSTIGTLAAFANLYPDPIGRAEFATGIASNPALVVLAGTLPSPSLGGLTMWRMGVLGGVLTSLMTMLTVIRRTRAEEESGRTELIAATVVGRAAGLTSALITALAPCLVIASVITIGVAAQGESVTGALAMGLAIAGPGVVFAGVAAVAAQLVETARAAMGLTGIVLAASFLFRAIGDVSSLTFLSWISPLGWTEKVAPFGVTRWWVLLLFPVTSVGAVTIAVKLLGRRDIGLALLPARLGSATGQLSSTLALATRLQRGTLIGWTVGLTVMGALVGSIVDGVADLFGDNPQMVQVLQRMGGSGGLTDAMLTAMASVIGLLCSVYAIGAALRPATEESALRAEPLLATAVSRIRWLAGHVLFVVAGPVAILTAAGTALGTAHGIRSTAGFADGFADGFGAVFVQLPAVWVLGAIAVLIVGVVPGWRSAAWAILATLLLLTMLGPTLQFPDWLVKVSPFSHLGTFPSAPISVAPLAVLTLIAAVLMGAGLGGLRRRDLRSH